jgi:hypothetical protein
MPLVISAYMLANLVEIGFGVAIVSPQFPAPVALANHLSTRVSFER